MADRPSNWKDRSKDPDGYGSSFDFQMKEQRIAELAHQHQTAILFLRGHELHKGKPEDTMSTGPKHLRVGVDSAHVSHAALVGLLVEKGIIKYQDYMDAMVEFWEREVEADKRRLKEYFGRDIELH